MNYINTLQNEIAALKNVIRAYDAGNESLRSYLQSEKFWTEPQVNSADVLARMAENRSHVLDVMAENHAYVEPA